MKKILLSLAVYFLASLICTVLAIIFIEGWPATLTAVAFLVIYFFAGLLACKYFPRLWWMAGFIISFFQLIGFSFGGEEVKYAFQLLSHPAKIDSKNFYAVLPFISFLAAVAGSYIGFKLSSKKAAMVQAGQV